MHLFTGNVSEKEKAYPPADVYQKTVANIHIKLINKIKMKKILLLLIIAALSTILLSCNKKQEKSRTHIEDVGFEHKLGFEEAELTSRSSNPYGLAVAINSPFNSPSETHSAWSFPHHHIPWLGQWSSDLWGDDGLDNQVPWEEDERTTCNKEIYIDATPIKLFNGEKPQGLKAKLLQSSYGCKSKDFYQGGYAQIWEIIATYNGSDYPIGRATYAHLAHLQYKTVGTVVNIDSKLYIGKAFWGFDLTDCWGSCHIHFELTSYQGEACYSFGSSDSNITQLGIIGGNGLTGGTCPAIEVSSEPVNLALNAVDCLQNSAYNSDYNCQMAYDGNLSTKWVSDGTSIQSSIVVDLGGVKDISKIVVKHAGANGEPKESNTEQFKIEYGSSNIWGPWTHFGIIDNYDRANESEVNVDFTARYVHLYIIDPGVDNYSRIPEIEIWGN